MTFNALAVVEAVRHGFDQRPGKRLTRGGTITEYLAVEREALLAGLNQFTQEAPATSAASTPVMSAAV